MSNNGVFIIESLTFEDEKEKIFEGKIIREILKMLGVKAEYYYIRTKKELKYLIKEFDNSEYKYLHLSFHGNEEGVAMPLENNIITFKQLSDMFKLEQKSQRLFLSSCSAMKGDAVKGLLDTKFKTISGPIDDIEFSDATIFWSTLYHLLYKSPDNTKRLFEDKIDSVATIFNIQMRTLIRKKNTYNEHVSKVEYA